jgi:aldehyde:ferredoxin oxidoreductase
MMGGFSMGKFMGRIVDVDLSNGALQASPFPEYAYRNFLGGRGFNV